MREKFSNINTITHWNAFIFYTPCDFFTQNPSEMNSGCWWMGEKIVKSERTPDVDVSAPFGTFMLQRFRSAIAGGVFKDKSS